MAALPQAGAYTSYFLTGFGEGNDFYRVAGKGGNFVPADPDIRSAVCFLRRPMAKKLAGRGGAVERSEYSHLSER